MTNRYYTTNQELWIGPTQIGPGDPTSKRVSQFIFDGADDTPIPGLREAHFSATVVLNELRVARDEMVKSGRFTPLGVSEQLGDRAMTGTLPAIKRAQKKVDDIRKSIVEKHSGLALANPSEDERASFEEIRSAMRSMTKKDRDAFLKEHRQDSVVARAIAGAIPALSGVDALTHQHIAAEQIEREHGETIAELRDLDEVVSAVDRVTKLAREEVREVIGVNSALFEQIAKVAEANHGELPFRVEQQIVNGATAEVARVYDLQAKRWRDAQPAEIAANNNREVA